MQTTTTRLEAEKRKAPAIGHDRRGRGLSAIKPHPTPTPRRDQDGNWAGCSWFYNDPPCGCELCEQADAQRRAEILDRQTEDVCAACGLRFATGWIDLCHACISEIEGMTGHRIQPEPENERMTLPLPL